MPGPTTHQELRFIVFANIKQHGYDCDLNHLDVSGVTDMRRLFADKMPMMPEVDPAKFRGDISKWNVSGVTDMSEMFAHGQFNGDISSWDVRSVMDFSGMFLKSKFCGDLSRWQVNPKAVCPMAVPADSLGKMKQPSFFHWNRALQASLDMPWEWTAHLCTMQKTAKMLGMSPPEAAVFIQEQWLWEQQPKFEAVALPPMEPG